VADCDETEGSYGLPAERVLLELMELDTARDPGWKGNLRFSGTW